MKLVKKSEDGVVANLKFKISGNGIDRTYTTNEKGENLIENLVAGEYTITEVDTPNKYVQPKTQVVTVKPAQTTAVTFDNVLKKFNIFITKTDEETGSTPQGDAILNGAEYDIYNAQGDFIEHIKAEGNVAKSSLLPLGTYKIYETVPPQGYTLNEEPMTVTGDFDGQTVEIGRADTGISDRVIKGQVAVTKFADKPLTGDTEDDGVKLPLEGIEFTLTLKSTGEEACKIVTDADGYAITPMLPYGTYRIEETKGADGYRRIEPFDIVIDQNGKIYKYILENTVYETDVKIIKKDAETGKVIPLAGTQFKIKDSEGNWVKQKYNYPVPTEIDTFETAQDGTLVLPEPLRYGSYELHEVKAPDGYTLSKEPIPFTVTSENPSTMLEVVCSNQPVKGTVTIEKLGERFTGADFHMTEYGKLFTPIYELKGLEGISFDIIASEDIATPDGTVRYEAGTVVDTITTGADGKTTSRPLYLGKYQAVEKNTEDGFVLDTQKHPFELTYKDQHTEIVTASMRVENQRQKAKVSLVKEFEALCNQTYSPLSSVVFGVYAKEDILTASGEIGIEKGSLVDVFAVDEMGNGMMNTDIPAGSYFVKELATGNGYILSDREYPFEFQHMGTEAPVIPIHINDGKPIENKLMRGDIEIVKTSEDGKIEGISFKVSGKTAVGTDYEEIFTTDKDGKIHIENLPVGEYTVSEVADDKTIGYITPDDQTVKVENGNTTTAEFENILQRGGIRIEKSAEGETDLSGFEFEISGTSLTGVSYMEVFKTDKNGIIEVKDLLVGEYTVKELANDKTESYVLPADQLITVQHGETAEVKIENRKIRGNVEITKKSNDGKLLAGVVFGIFTEDGNKVLEITTDSNGKALAKELEYGDYYLQELKTIDGYKLNDKKFRFSVRENGGTIQIEVINDTIREVPPTKTDTPKTGDNTNVGLFMGDCLPYLVLDLQEHISINAVK
ncbi:MSCRAMM family protein [Streptococcus pasteurianus]|uniref:MSCRAMM family protein n=1 Tax=Streptococcus pasteurianus TaxID=197614 RepID=UPI0035BC405E